MEGEGILVERETSFHGLTKAYELTAPFSITTKTMWLLVLKRTISTERRPLVDGSWC
jgi:hypothetical protein